MSGFCRTGSQREAGGYQNEAGHDKTRTSREHRASTEDGDDGMPAGPSRERTFELQQRLQKEV